MGAPAQARRSRSSSILTALPFPTAEWAPNWDASAVGFTLPLACPTWSATPGWP